MAREENSRICLNMQLIAILSRIGIYIVILPTCLVLIKKTVYCDVQYLIKLNVKSEKQDKNDKTIRFAQKTKSGLPCK